MDYLELVPAAWRLRFPADAEQDFIAYYNASALNAIRIALAVGLVLYASFGLLDQYSAPLSTSTAWFYRFSVGCPAVFVALAFSYLTPLRAFLQAVMTAMCIVAGVAVVLIIKHCQPSELAYDHYYVGLIIIMMFTGSWARLRFWHALVAHSCIVGSYVVLILLDHHVGQNQLVVINNSVFLGAAFFVASLTGYIFEVDSRIDFLQWKTIDADKNTSNAQREELTKQAQQLAHTLAVLKQTQVQLVQREKMAALGELTAGVAHEIQNPLNFVKNFAEVSREMVEEIQHVLAAEQLSGPAAVVPALLLDLGMMQQKIAEHGVRADAIVKGMLEHSRPSTGEREPTDLNHLAEEALRLSYHNRQTQDPAFTATLTTELDPGLGLVDVVSPDIWRVLTNLFGNAFYALAQKQRHQANGYVPEVRVQTKRRDKTIEIRVRDNGPGMSEKVQHKVFQPFFTTKPPGEGTGLGLSLCHDIVAKGHGGTLTVSSKEGEYAEFCVSIPAP